MQFARAEANRASGAIVVSRHVQGPSSRRSVAERLGSKCEECMAVQCNIDRQGRRFRMIVGVVCILVAVALFLAAWTTASRALAITGAFTAAAAALCVGQATAGYCVLRGLGVKTRI